MVTTPICLFTFLRFEPVARIIDVLRKVDAKKIYLRSDNGRNEAEIAQAEAVRTKIRSMIDWDCEVVEMFAEKNRGVFEQIGVGAIEIFSKEKRCIFLEDDNLPSEDFFPFCEAMLDRYEDDPRVLMVCGTNYCGASDFDGKDYAFVQALLPCGWASWSDKFENNYNKELIGFDTKQERKAFLAKYRDRRLGAQQLDSILGEVKRREEGARFRSWDYHLIASIMQNDLLVIYPRSNLIRNIGVDEFSIHDTNKKGMKNPMTKRFCEVPFGSFKSSNFIGPDSVAIDPRRQKECDRKILLPLSLRVKICLVKIRNRIFKRP